MPDLSDNVPADLLERHALARQGQIEALYSVDVADAGRISGFSESTIRRAIDSGDLAHQRAGRAISIRLVDLQSWMDRRRYFAAS